MTSSISSLFDGMEPIPDAALHDRSYAIKVNVSGVGWVQVQTTTEFICNGMLEQAAAKIAAGEYTKCEPPRHGERVVQLA